MARKLPTPENPKRDRRADNPGRPPRYNPHIHPKAAKALCAKGATIAELAAAFDVAISTIWLWKTSHPEFIESCRLGLEAATDRVERSMFERAVGYTHESVKLFLPAGASEPVYAPYLKHVPPDPRACEFWLTNRRPDRWKHKQKIEHNEAADSPLRLLYADFAAMARTEDRARRLTGIPGIGALNATVALVAAVGSAAPFDNGRDLAA